MVLFDRDRLYVDSDGDIWFSNADGFWRFVSVGEANNRTVSGLQGRPPEDYGPYRWLEGSVANVVRSWLEKEGLLALSEEPPAQGRFLNLDIESR